MERNVLAIVPGPKEQFKLIGDISAIEHLITVLKTTDEDDEYHVSHSDTGFEAGPYSQQQRDEEIVDLEQLVMKLRNESYLVNLIESIPKKKNGTFAKNRTRTLFRAYTNSHLAPEWFGWFAEEVIVKVTDDYEAVLVVERRCEKWG